MTRSAGQMGLILAGSPPNLLTASRILAKSTTAGTPVKSCKRTRLGLKGISTEGPDCLLLQSRMASTSVDLT